MRLTDIISFALLFAISLTVSGQKGSKQTVVLNDGSRLTGTIIADSSDFIKVKIKKPSVIIINKSQVSSYDSRNIDHIDKNVRHGYSIRFSTSLLAGSNNFGNTGDLSIHLSNAYRFRNGLSAGFGTGIEKLDVAVIPVYAELRFYPLNARVSPMLYIKSGYGFPMNNNTGLTYNYYLPNPEEKGGFMFNAGTGIELCSWGGNAVSVGLGYRYQQIIFSQVNQWWGGEPSVNEVVTRFNRIEVQFGFVFR